LATEQQIQSKLIKKLESEGYYVLKLSLTNKPGIPDLVALPKDCSAVFIEVKAKGKKPRPLQLYRIKEIKDHGIKACWYNGEQYFGLEEESKSDK
jgi:Holliday junction resolvase-like predicted endonuclease